MSQEPKIIEIRKPDGTITDSVDTSIPLPESAVNAWAALLLAEQRRAVVITTDPKENE